MERIKELLKRFFCKELLAENSQLKISVRDKDLYITELEADWYKLQNEVLAQLNIIEKESYGRKLAESQLFELTNKKTVDIKDLKNWYYTKFSSDKPWLYNARSNGLMDIKDVLNDGNDITMLEATTTLIDELSLTSNNTPEEIIEKIAWYFVNKKNWQYTKDIDQYKVIEYWERASKSWVSRKGDCDSLAILMHNLIYHSFKILDKSEHYWRLKMVAMGTIVEAHAFNIWLGEDGEWYVIESTLDLRNSLMKTWLKTPLRNNNLYSGVAWGYADKTKSWSGSVTSLEPYKVKQ